MYKVIMV